MKVRIRIPKVPMTSKKEEVDMAIVRIDPDCKTDSRARFSAKYRKNRKIHMYMRKKVAFFTEPYLKRSK